MLMIGLDGDYEDAYVKTAAGWRFKQRTHHAVFDAGSRAEPAGNAALQ